MKKRLITNTNKIKFKPFDNYGKIIKGMDWHKITYNKNNNGTAASEIAVAMLVYEKARAAGRGTMIDLIDPTALKEEYAR